MASSFSETRGGSGGTTWDRMSRWILSTLRACGADDGTSNRTPSAWMIMPPTLAHGQNPFPNRVLSVGHSNRAEMGHSCLEDKPTAQCDAAGFCQAEAAPKPRILSRPRAISGNFRNFRPLKYARSEKYQVRTIRTIGGERRKASKSLHFTRLHQHQSRLDSRKIVRICSYLFVH